MKCRKVWSNKAYFEYERNWEKLTWNIKQSYSGLFPIWIALKRWIPSPCMRNGGGLCFASTGDFLGLLKTSRNLWNLWKCNKVRFLGYMLARQGVLGNFRGADCKKGGARHSVTISFPPLPCPIHHLSSGLVRPGGELAGNELSVLSSSPLLHCVLVGGNELSVLSYRPLCPAESQHWPVTCSIWGQDTNTCNTYVILPPTSEKYG